MTSVQTANISVLSSRLRLKFISKSFKVTDEKEKAGVLKWVHTHKSFFPLEVYPLDTAAPRNVLLSRMGHS